MWPHLISNAKGSYKNSFKPLSYLHQATILKAPCTKYSWKALTPSVLSRAECLGLELLVLLVWVFISTLKFFRPQIKIPITFSRHQNHHCLPNTRESCVPFLQSIRDLKTDQASQTFYPHIKGFEAYQAFPSLIRNLETNYLVSESVTQSIRLFVTSAQVIVAFKVEKSTHALSSTHVLNASVTERRGDQGWRPLCWSLCAKIGI